jgi:broad specificity phosphatase PhoE
MAIAFLRVFRVARRGCLSLLGCVFCFGLVGFVGLGGLGSPGGHGGFGAAHAQDRLSLQNLEALLRSEKGKGLVILVRHAETVSGIGDPPGFRLDDCSTQRNLSAEGRTQSRRLGEWFTSRGLVPTAVRSSQWCRCLDTAEEAFAKAVPITAWPALNSTFQGRGDSQAQQAQIQAHLAGRARGAPMPDSRTAPARHAGASVIRAIGVADFEVWVTHQVMVSALTGQYVSMGEMVVARPDAQGRLQLVGRVSSDFR